MSPGEPRRVLSLVDAIAVVVGIVIGAGIFHLPGIVAAGLQNDSLILFAWLVGGVISLLGALCFAELVTAYPHPGGEYHRLHGVAPSISRCRSSTVTPRRRRCLATSSAQ